MQKAKRSHAQVCRGEYGGSVPAVLTSLPPAHLGQLGLGEARLAHLGGLAHGDVALGQGALGEWLGCHVLAGLAVGEIRLAGSREPKAVLLAPPTTSLAFWGTPA